MNFENKNNINQTNKGLLKKKFFFNNPLDTIQNCENLINNTFWILLGLAGIECILAFVIGPFLPIFHDVIFMIIFAVLLKKYQSRTISLFIFIHISGIFIINFDTSNIFISISNIILFLFIIYVAFRTIPATFKLFKLRSLSISWKNFIIKSVIFLILLIILLTILFVTTITIQNEILKGSLFLAFVFLSAFIAYAGFFPMSDKLKIKYKKDIL